MCIGGYFLVETGEIQNVNAWIALFDGFAEFFRGVRNHNDIRFGNQICSR